MKNQLPVSEMFYSIQGEGFTTGVPSVFLRLKGCNLLCDGSWRCDTIEQWKTGKNTPFEDILTTWKKEGWLDALQNGAHLILTGGEPMLYQDQLVTFIKHLPLKPFIEVETNATISPSPEFIPLINQFNLSPKGSNSGMSLDKRHNKEALNTFTTLPTTTFKFVIHSKEDLKEFQKELIVPYKIPKEKICLMPAASTQDELAQNSDLVSKLCKTHGYRFSSRLQLAIWNQQTGV